jgi:hypothetical protein
MYGRPVQRKKRALAKELNVTVATINKYAQKVIGYTDFDMMNDAEIEEIKSVYLEVQEKKEKKNKIVESHVTCAVLAHRCKITPIKFGAIASKLGYFSTNFAGKNYYLKSKSEEIIQKVREQLGTVKKKDDKYPQEQSFDEVEFVETVRIDPKELGSWFFRITGCILEALEDNDPKTIHEKLEVMKRLTINKLPPGKAKKYIIGKYGLINEFTGDSELANKKLILSK